MGIFDPKLEGGSAFVQPSQQPSGAQALASGITNIGSALLTVAQKDQQAQDQYNKAMAEADQDAASIQAKVNLQRDLRVAQALRKAGRVSEATAKENNALANATASGFNFGSAEGKAIVETSLGRPFEAVGLTQDEYLNKTLLSDSEFMQQDYLATYAYGADLTEAQRFEVAKLNKARTEQAKLAIEQRGLISQNNWDTQGRAAYDQIFASQVNPILGKLQIAAQQGINVDPQSVVQAQLQFQATVSSLPRPQNITDDQWESWTSKVQGVNDLFEAMINRGSKIKAATASAFLQSVSSDPTLTEQAKFLITNAPDDLLVGAGQQLDVVSQLKAMSPTPYVDINTIGNPVEFSQATPELKVLEDGVKGSDAKDLLNTTVSLGKTLTMLSDTASPERVKGFVNEAYRSAVALQKMSFDFDDYASGGDIRKIYNGTILGGIQQVAKFNPDVAKALLTKHIEALDTQYATGQAKLNRINKGLFSMDENGMVSVNPDRWQSRYAGRVGFVGAVPEELTKALVEYNGDIAALIRDKGAKYQGGMNPSIKFFVQSSDAKSIMSEAPVYLQHLDALRSINAVRLKFRDSLNTLDSGSIIIGSGADTGLKGSQGDGTLVNDNLMAALVSIESGGDPNAKSPDGALGLYQILPATAKDPGYGIQPLSTGEDILAAPEEEQRRFAEDYIRAMQLKYGSLELALAAYNAGPGNVDKYLKGEMSLPKETRDYIRKFKAKGVLSKGDAQVNQSVGLGRSPYTMNPVDLSEEYPSPSAIAQRENQDKLAAEGEAILGIVTDFLPGSGLKDLASIEKAIEEGNTEETVTGLGLFALGMVPFGGLGRGAVKQALKNMPKKYKETLRERLERQGGALNSRLPSRKIQSALEDHGFVPIEKVEMLPRKNRGNYFEVLDSGTVKVWEVLKTDKVTGKVQYTVKTFKDGATLKSLRDWLGY